MHINSLNITVSKSSPSCLWKQPVSFAGDGVAEAMFCLHLLAYLPSDCKVYCSVGVDFLYIPMAFLVLSSIALLLSIPKLPSLRGFMSSC
ncbi:hypothetical protein V6N12_004734 [Hibiscus sabdariffa]|uniref:Uncharacterized protein n=1 Tax=Hibiscus sabdariffa TaxID=183260 RepID=A0ABR2CP35_9ROSI